MRHALPLAAAALLAAACGGAKGDQRVENDAGGAMAPAVGAGGGVNGNGINDRNAARPESTSGTGAPSNHGLGTATGGHGDDITQSTGAPAAGTTGGTTGSNTANRNGTAYTAPSHGAGAASAANAAEAQKGGTGATGPASAGSGGGPAGRPGSAPAQNPRP